MEIFTGELKGKRGFSPKHLVGGYRRKSPDEDISCLYFSLYFNDVDYWLSFSLFILITHSAGVETGKDRK